MLSGELDAEQARRLRIENDINARYGNYKAYYDIKEQQARIDEMKEAGPTRRGLMQSQTELNREQITRSEEEREQNRRDREVMQNYYRSLMERQQGTRMTAPVLPQVTEGMTVRGYFQSAFGNNTQISQGAAIGGVDVDTRMSDLTPQQRQGIDTTIQELQKGGIGGSSTNSASVTMAAIDALDTEADRARALAQGYMQSGNIRQVQHYLDLESQKRKEARAVFLEFDRQRRQDSKEWREMIEDQEKRADKELDRKQKIAKERTERRERAKKAEDQLTVEFRKFNWSGLTEPQIRSTLQPNLDQYHENSDDVYAYIFEYTPGVLFGSDKTDVNRYTLPTFQNPKTGKTEQPSASAWWNHPNRQSYNDFQDFLEKFVYPYARMHGYKGPTPWLKNKQPSWQ